MYNSLWYASSYCINNINNFYLLRFCAFSACSFINMVKVELDKTSHSWNVSVSWISKNMTFHPSVYLCRPGQRVGQSKSCVPDVKVIPNQLNSTERPDTQYY